MTNIVKSFIADERGATAIEYGLIAAGIATTSGNSCTPLATHIDRIFVFRFMAH